MPVELECEYCSASFEVKPYREDSARFCSDECHYAWQSGRPVPAARNRVERTCAHCSDSFEVRRSRAENGRGRFCSIECRRPAGRVELTCANCSASFEVVASRAESAKYCSQECMYEGRREPTSEPPTAKANGSDPEPDQPDWVSADGLGTTNLPICQNCGERLSNSYAAVFAPEGEDPRVCPACPDMVRMTDGSVREARSTRTESPMVSD